jgi:hypothetical protein
MRNPTLAEHEAAMAEARGPDVSSATARFGAWTDQGIPADRSAWHPTLQRFYDYWLSIAPPGRLPGRQHVVPEDLGPLLPRVWMLDVHRDPLRFRYRLAGTFVVQSLGREITGHWVDALHPDCPLKAILHDRYCYAAETGHPTWRHGETIWERRPDQRWNRLRHFLTVENCIVPLATDGRTVDILFGASVLFDAEGNAD